MRSKNLLPHNQNDKKKKGDGFFSHHTQRFMDMWNWEYHVKLNKARWNRQTYHIFGIETEDFEITWESVFAYVHMHDKKIYCDSFQKTINEKRELDFEHRIIRKDGQERVIFLRSKVILGEDGEVERIFGTIQDITEVRGLKLRLEQSEERFKSVVDHLSVGIWSYDFYNNEITFCSKGLSEIFGISIDMLSPGLLKEFIFQDDKELVKRNASLLEKGEEVNHQFRILDGKGRIKWLEGQFTPHLNQEGDLIRMDGIVKDITERVEYTESLAYMADHDYLTKLPNRRYIERKLQEQVVAASEKTEQFAVFYVDLDRFKYINDTFGHEIGDKFLVTFAERLQLYLGSAGFVARIGGDEFTILLNKVTGLEEAIKLANKMIAKMEMPFEIEGYELFITMSIGISLYPRDGEDFRTLLRNADAARYKAKELGRNDWQIFSPSMNIESFKLYDLEKDLRKSLINEELYIEFQPKVNPKTSKVEGAEALIRWNHPEWGIVSPNEFIPLAEESGFIFKIGDWVVKEVCEMLGIWLRKGIPVVPISVNISPKRLLRADFVKTVKETIEAAGIEPKLIELELTEQTIIRNVDVTKNIIAELKELGVKIALDDFGTGYSSLSYLKDLEIDTLKIDKSFIDGITLQTANDAIVKSLIFLSKEIGIHIVAEGVETKEQLLFLLQQGCQQIQGYIYSKPVPAMKLQQLLRREFMTPQQTNMLADKVENRRKYERFQLRTPLSAEMTIVKFKNKEVKLGYSKVLIKNVSLGGLNYRANSSLPVQKDVVVLITTQILGKEVKFFGRNVWKSEEDGFYEYGFEFIINEIERDQLEPIFHNMLLLA